MSARAGDPPIIATLLLDDDSFAFFDRQRQAYFPPERNFIPAHLTLFHHLPGDALADIVRAARAVAPNAAIALRVSGLRFLGRGVAYEIHSEALDAFRDALRIAFAARLTAQDRQGFRAHVTVQNKVSKDEARALFERLSGRFAPFSAQGVGVAFWRYLGGPWGEAGAIRFADA